MNIGSEWRETSSFFLAVLFLVYSSANLVNISRDRFISRNFESDKLRFQLRGFGLSYFGAFLSVVFSAVLACLNAKPAGSDNVANNWFDQYKFLVIGLSFIVCTSVNVAKAERDRFDSIWFSDMEQEASTCDLEKYSRIMRKMSEGSIQFMLVNMLSFCGALCAFFSGTISEGIDGELRVVFFLQLFIQVLMTPHIYLLLTDKLTLYKTSSTPAWKILTTVGFLLMLCQTASIQHYVHERTHKPSLTILHLVSSLLVLCSTCYISLSMGNAVPANRNHTTIAITMLIVSTAVYIDGTLNADLSNSIQIILGLVLFIVMFTTAHVSKLFSEGMRGEQSNQNDYFWKSTTVAMIISCILITIRVQYYAHTTVISEDTKKKLAVTHIGSIWVFTSALSLCKFVGRLSDLKTRPLR